MLGLKEVLLVDSHLQRNSYLGGKKPRTNIVVIPLQNPCHAFLVYSASSGMLDDYQSQSSRIQHVVDLHLPSSR